MAKLKEKIAYLGSVDAYRPHPKSVEVIETHLSFVFLAGPDVYKLKKPVRNETFDLGSLSARETNCREELRVNRRLAPDTYLGLTRLSRAENGAFSVNGEGQTVEWLVHMRRLDRQDLLDDKLRRGDVSDMDIDRLAKVLIPFYLHGAAPANALALYLERLEAAQRINREILSRDAFGLWDATTQQTVAALDAAQPAAFKMIAERAQQGLLREGHGDLRPEHVWLGRPVQVIDALEFDRAMRMLDPFDEVHYFGMECALLGAPWIGAAMRERLGQVLPSPPVSLLAYYGAFRCVLRARIAIAHLFDPAPRTPQKWAIQARAYLEQARHELGSA